MPDVSLPILTASTLSPARVGVALVLAVHLALGGLLMGGFLIAALITFWSRFSASTLQAARALAERTAPSRGYLVLLYLSALLVVLLTTYVYRPEIGAIWWLPGLGLLAIGLGGVELCRNRLLKGDVPGVRYQSLALAAGAILPAAYFFFLCVLALMFMPGKWPVVSYYPQMLLSWSAFFTWGQFLCLAFALGGAFLLPAGGRHGPNCQTATQHLSLRIAAGMMTPFLLLLPLPLVLDLLLLPVPAVSPATFATTAFLLALAGCVLLALLRFWTAAGGSLLRTPIIVLLLTMFALLALQGEVRRGHALGEHLLAQSAVRVPMPGTLLPTDESAAPPMAELELPTAESDALIAHGQRVFANACSVCHAFERRQVGPPINAVILKYLNQLDHLVAFITDPQPVDPDYPPMPRLGLPETDIHAVSAYLLDYAQTLAEAAQ